MPKKGDVFRQLKIVHAALLSGAFAFTFTVFLGHRYVTNNKVNENFERIFLVLVLFVAASAMLGGLTLFKKKVAILQNSQEPVQSKMDQYKKACVIFWAMLEGAAILSAMGILMTGNYMFIVVSALLIIILVLFVPRKESIIASLNLESNEVAELESNN
jgi:hypothetical protein